MQLQVGSRNIVQWCLSHHHHRHTHYRHPQYHIATTRSYHSSFSVLQPTIANDDSTKIIKRKKKGNILRIENDDSPVADIVEDEDVKHMTTLLNNHTKKNVNTNKKTGLVDQPNTMTMINHSRSNNNNKNNNHKNNNMNKNNNNDLKTKYQSQQQQSQQSNKAYNSKLNNKNNNNNKTKKKKKDAIPMIDDGTGEDFDMFDSWFEEHEEYNEQSIKKHKTDEDESDFLDEIEKMAVVRKGMNLQHGEGSDILSAPWVMAASDPHKSRLSSSSTLTLATSNRTEHSSNRRHSPDPFASLKSQLYDSKTVRLAQKSGIESAKAYFDSIEEPTKLDHDAMIFAYGQVGDVDRAKQVFEQNRKRFFPHDVDVDSLAVFAGVLFKLFRFESVIELLSDSSQAHLWWPNTYYVLVSSYTRLGKIESAIEFINTLHKYNTQMQSDYLYRVVIEACCAKLNIAQAEMLFRQMINNNIVPSEEVASTMLNVLVSEGEYSKSIALLYSMRKYGYTPRPQTIPAIYKQLKEGDVEKCVQWLLIVYKMYPNMELTLALTQTLIQSLDKADLNRNTLKDLLSKFKNIPPEQLKSEDQLSVERKIEQFNTSIRALASAKDLKRVNEILHIMSLQGLPITESTRFEVFYVSTYYSIRHATALFEEEMSLLGPEKITFRYYKYLFRAYLRFKVNPNMGCYDLIKQMADNKIIAQPSHLEYLLLSCYQYKSPDVMIYLLTIHERLFPSHKLSLQTCYYCIRVLSSMGYSSSSIPILAKMKPESPPILIVKKVLSGLQKENDSAGIINLFTNYYSAPSSTLAALALRILYVMADFDGLWTLASLLFKRDPFNFDYDGYSFLFKRRTIFTPDARTASGDRLTKEAVTIYHRKNKDGEMLRRLPHHFTSVRAQLALDIFFALRKTPAKVTGEVLQGVYNKLVAICEEYPEHRHHLPAILKDLENQKDRQPTLEIVARIGHMFQQGYKFEDEQVQQHYANLVSVWVGSKQKTETNIDVIYRVYEPQVSSQLE